MKRQTTTKGWLKLALIAREAGFIEDSNEYMERWIDSRHNDREYQRILKIYNKLKGQL